MERRHNYYSKEKEWLIAFPTKYTMIYLADPVPVRAEERLKLVGSPVVANAELG